MTNSAKVYLSLRGDFDPNDITNFIGVKATDTMRSGEKNPGKVPACSHRNYSSDEVEAEVIDIYELTQKLVKQLKHKELRFIEAKKSLILK